MNNGDYEDYQILSEILSHYPATADMSGIIIRLSKERDDIKKERDHLKEVLTDLCLGLDYSENLLSECNGEISMGPISTRQDGAKSLKIILSPAINQWWKENKPEDDYEGNYYGPINN